MITIPVYGTLSMSNQPGLSILPRQVKAKRSGFGSTSNTTVDCEVSRWGLYGECCKGKKYKTRTVVTKPSGQGKDCPKLKKQKHCSPDNCDVDCEVSRWGLYGECCKGKKIQNKNC